MVFIIVLLLELLLFSSSSDRLVQNSVTLSRWFSHYQQHFTLSSVPALFIAFSQL